MVLQTRVGGSEANMTLRLTTLEACSANSQLDTRIFRVSYTQTPQSWGTTRQRLAAGTPARRMACRTAWGNYTQVMTGRSRATAQWAAAARRQRTRREQISQVSAALSCMAPLRDDVSE